jgi:uncharacterized protein (DUF1810 family)
VTEADLIHFVNAQSEVYDQVTEELTEGRKRTHWMWFIFPQLAGLGLSGMARRYAIRDLDHAKRYLADPLLGSRLCQHVHLMMGHKGKSALDILGSPDDLKFRSSLTLFAEAASDDSDRVLFKRALDQFYGGKADPRTRDEHHLVADMIKAQFALSGSSFDPMPIAATERAQAEEPPI